MGATAERMTVEEYFAITVEGDRKHLVDGTIVVNDEPQFDHSIVHGRIFGALYVWTHEREGRGVAVPPTNVVLDEHNVYGPDVIWIAEEHRPPARQRKLARVPDLCVEVRSPSTWHYDTGAKKRAYERGGLPELWLMDNVEERVLVCRRSRPDAPAFDVQLELGIGDELTSPQLPGFALPVEQIFGDA
jgi:Uma2 family endonuclease